MLKKKTRNTLARIFLLVLTMFVVNIGPSKKEAKAAGLSVGINWLRGKDEYRTNYIATRNVKKQADKAILVSTELGGVGREAVDLSFQEGAPIVLTNTNSLNDITSKLLSSLKVKEVIIVGDENSVSKNVENALRQYYKVSRLVPQVLYTAGELASIIPQGNTNARLTFISTNSLGDFLSGLNHQSVGGQRVLPRSVLDRKEVNKYKAADIVTTNNNLEIAGKEYFDQNTLYDWYDALWIFDNKLRYDFLYETIKPEVLPNKIFKFTYEYEPFKMNLGTRQQYPTLLDAVQFRYNSQFAGIVGKYHKSANIKNLSTYDYATQIYRPKFEVYYTVREYAYTKNSTYVARKFTDLKLKNLQTDEEKLKAIYDWIVTRNNYVAIGKSKKNLDVENMASVIFAKEGNCVGVTELFNDIAFAEGYRVFSESGYRGRKDNGHAWSKIILNGEIYSLDAVAKLDKHGYNYFLFPEEEERAKGYILD